MHIIRGLNLRLFNFNLVKSAWFIRIKSYGALYCLDLEKADFGIFSDPHFWFPLALDWAVTNFKTPGGLKIFPGTRQSLPHLCHGRRNIDVTLPITPCWTDISVIVWAQTFVAFLSIIQSKYDPRLRSPWTMTNFREG